MISTTNGDFSPKQHSRFVFIMRTLSVVRT